MRIFAKGVLLAQLLSMVMLLAFSERLQAQNLTGEIYGTVQDTTGAVIPNATITINNAGENLVVRTLHTDQQGQFVAPALATGAYLVTVEASGFQTATVRRVEVNVNQHTPIRVTLPTGSASQTVTVVANPVAVETQSPAAGTLISGTQVRQLSLSSRNFEQLLSLQPGITGNVPGTVDRGIVSSSGATNASLFQVNGQRPSQNDYFLDGADMLSRGGNQQVSFFPSVDALQEMSLLRNSFGAQYGGAGSAIISMQTHEGTAAFHGGGFDFFRSQVLNANGYFNKLGGIPRPGIRYNDYGYHIGGPVWIPHMMDRHNPKTFFFFLQEFLRTETQSGLTISNIPTAAQRQGMFSAPVCVAYSGTKCTSGATSITQIDPTAQAYLTDIINKTPLPNNPNDPQGLIASQVGFNNETQTVIRIDHQFNQKLSVFFRYIDDPYNLVIPNGYSNGNPPPGVGVANLQDGGTNYLGHVTFLATSKMVIDGGYSYLSNWINSQPTGLATKVNAPNIRPVLPYLSTLPEVPTVKINGGVISAADYVNQSHSHQIFVNVTNTAHRNTFYFGGNFEAPVLSGRQGPQNAGVFTFSKTAVPTGSTATQFMQSFANFLEGNVATFTQLNLAIPNSDRTNYAEAYFQDDFRPTPRLTFNGGVRYSFFETQRSEPFLGQYTPLTNFDPSRYKAAAAPTIGTDGLICSTAPCPGGATPNSNADPLNGIIIADKNSPYGRSVYDQAKLDFAPRVGFAWDVLGNGKTSFRGGYGIYYIQNRGALGDTLITNNPPFVATTTISNASFHSPGNGIPVGSSSPLVMQAVQTRFPTPYAQDFSLDLQQQIAQNTILDVGYYGNQIRHMIGQVDINQAPVGLYAQKAIIPGNVVTAGNTAVLNQIRPYQGYGAIQSILPIFVSNYNSLQMSVKKRFSSGSIINVNYTWSKSLANSQADRNQAPQNSANLAPEYGLTSYNRAHVLSADVVYYLPFFRERHDLAGYTLGGWEVTGIISYGSGLPSTATTTGVDPGGLGLLGSNSQGRPDQVSNPNSSAPHTLNRWFNTAAFTQVPTGQFRPGNAPVQNIIGPGYGKWDLSLFKNFPIKGSAVMQLRAESFNAFNHVTFVGLSTSLGDSNFGQVTSAAEARVLQLAAKISF